MNATVCHCAIQRTHKHRNIQAQENMTSWADCCVVCNCAIQRTHEYEHKRIQTQTNMVVLVGAQTVATCSEIIVTTIVQQFGSLRAAFQTLMDFVRLLTPSRRVEKIPHG